DCALAGLARASGGPVSLTALSLEGGQVTARLAAPPSDATATALKALGFQIAPTSAQDVRLSSAACR
ncbi:MAG TPA: hypothetical protein VFE13_07265, partial [Caulobacteraceae bacterium]|nr:hypothetical protein [Caulobacteraceae bacterium]